MTCHSFLYLLFCSIASASLWFIILSLDSSYLLFYSLLQPSCNQESCMTEYPCSFLSLLIASASLGFIVLLLLPHRLLFCSLIQLHYTHHIITSSSYLLFCLLLQEWQVDDSSSWRLIPHTFSSAELLNKMVITQSTEAFLPQTFSSEELTSWSLYSSSVTYSSYLLFCWLL